ncbi:hypothetical protein TOTORO_02110 [Serratia phage vB_SmaS-Totoro]|nr:hypothetical protein TOTORO_02110 [Serratia phage vB_SmaS-Totoro]
MSDVKAKETTLVISAEIRSLADKLKENMEISEHGVMTLGENVFLDNAPKEVKAHFAAVQNYESEFATSLMLAGGEQAIDAIKGNKEIKRVAGVVATGNTQMAFNYTAPTGRKQDGSMKDPSITTVYRRKEHEDHTAVRQALTEKTRTGLFD